MWSTRNLVLWLLAIIGGKFNSAFSYEMNMTEYFKMPNLYYFDDYDRCLEEFPKESTYCFVRAEVIEQRNSESWNAIANFSKYYKHHFDHQQLYYGLCVSWCENLLSSMDNETRNSLITGTDINNKVIKTYLRLFSKEALNRQRYNSLLNQCVNRDLKSKHNLTAKSVVEYCVTNKDNVEQDAWNWTFYCVLCTLISLVILSSFYDLYLKNNRKDKLLMDPDHYKSPVMQAGTQICVAFSLARNWYRLNQPPSGIIGRDFRCIDCLKFFSMFLVIFAHTNWVMYEGALSNPQDLERVLHTWVGTLLAGGSVITITFLVISGLLLAVNWLEYMSKHNELSTLDYVKAFFALNLFRYIRITVPYAFVILLSGVSFTSSRGPMWRHIVDREQLVCRKNWWTNILYINNYVNTDERCLLQCWYLAADTHCFILGLCILICAQRWPKVRNILFGLVLIAFFAIPGIIVYVNKYSPVLVPTPQTQRNAFIADEQFANVYAPFHMNFSSYLCGMIAAVVYHEISNKTHKLFKSKTFQIWWYSLFPTAILWILSSHQLVQSYSETTIWGSVYASFQRGLWGVGVSVFLVGLTARIGWVFREFTCLPIFRILGRLTYGAFIIHLIVARILWATIRQPIYFGTAWMLGFTTATMTMSYILAFVLAMLIELPTSAFLKLARA